MSGIVSKVTHVEGIIAGKRRPNDSYDAIEGVSTPKAGRVEKCDQRWCYTGKK